jgi:hypothetical protein
MVTKELMSLIVVRQLCTAPPKMLDLVKASILDFWRKTLFDSITLHRSRKSSRILQAIDVSFESVRHKPYATGGQSLVPLLLVHPKVLITASVFVEKEVAK